jgi:hypothetical protein
MTVQGEPWDGRDALERLEAFVGEWREQVELPGVPSGRMTFAWELEHRFLLQRSRIDDPAFPDSLCVIAVDADGAGYTQHYFDARGVVRIYAMGFANGIWTLVRDAPDFTPLSFAQRFTGTFTEDGRTIHGAWESSPDGATWKRDFDVTYTKVA